MVRMNMNIKHEVNAALKLAIPMAAGQLAQYSLHIIDTLMCGRLGGLSLAGAGLGSSLLAMLWLPSSGIVSAVSPLCAQAHGSQNTDLVKATLKQALILSVFIFLPLFFILSNTKPLMHILGQPPELIPLADKYLLAARWGLLPGLGVAVLRNFMDSLGHPRAGMLVGISGIFINIFANWLLMFGKMGFPALGIAGTGWATTLVNSWMFVILMIWAYQVPQLKNYLPNFRDWRLEPPLFKEILRIGLPMGCGILAEVWLFIGTAFLMGHFGSTAVAAHQIALNIASTAFMVALGIGNASTVRVAHAIGKGNHEDAYRAGLIGILMGVSFMGVMGILLWTIPNLFIGLYLRFDQEENQAVIHLASHFLHIAALFQIFDAMQVTAQGALRGLKDTRIPMLLGLVCYSGIGLGGAWVLAYLFNWRETGLWAGLTIGLMTAGLTLTWRFRSHFRQH
jgi:multidrug resistance protein, MATE family